VQSNLDAGYPTEADACVHKAMLEGVAQRPRYTLASA